MGLSCLKDRHLSKTIRNGTALKYRSKVVRGKACARNLISRAYTIELDTFLYKTILVSFS